VTATDTPPSTGRVARAARIAGRRVTLMLTYAWEQNRYVDDGHLLTTEEAAAEGEAAMAFGREHFALITAQRAAVDAAISQRLDNWTIHRLAVADRAILRVGASELLYRPDVPPKVAISEAVDLAKAFGSDPRTPKLVNGVLDKLARDHRPDEVRPKPAAPA
jgi:transcription antitermination protein NusB